MEIWYNVFEATFWLSIASMTFAGCAMCVRYGFRSKCDRVKLCCGLLEIHREVELEGGNGVVDEKDDDEEEKKK